MNKTKYDLWPMVKKLNELEILVNETKLNIDTMWNDIDANTIKHHYDNNTLPTTTFRQLTMNNANDVWNILNELNNKLKIKNG